MNSLLLLLIVGSIAAQYPGIEHDTLEGYNYCEAGLPNHNAYKPMFKGGKLLTTIWMNRHGDRTAYNLLPEGYEEEPWSCALEQNHVHTNNFLPSTKYYQNKCDPNKSPFKYCSLNPFEKLFWKGNCSTGQLTTKGMLYQFKLGQNLKKIYIDKTRLLKKDWLESKDDILIRASDVWRTQQSAISLMSGMYSFDYNNMQDKHKHELPIFTLPAEIEYMVPNPKNCPNIAKYEKQVVESVAMKALLNYTLPMRKQFIDIVFKGNTTKKIESSKPLDFFYFVDVFQTRKCHNKKPICNLNNNNLCATKAMIDNSMTAANAQYRILYRDNEHQFPTLSKLRMGTFLLEMKRKFLAYISQLENRKDIINLNHMAYTHMGKLKKLYYYSGHDTSVTPLLGAINATEMRWPPYSSNIQFELWKESSRCRSNTKSNVFGHYFIRIFYNGKKLKTSWCSKQGCAIQKFLDYLDNDLKLIGGFEAYLPKHITDKPFNLVSECFKDVITTPNPNGTA